MDKREATHEHEKKKAVHLETQRISPLVHSMKVNIYNVNSNIVLVALLLHPIHKWHTNPCILGCYFSQVFGHYIYVTECTAGKEFMQLPTKCLQVPHSLN